MSARLCSLILVVFCFLGCDQNLDPKDPEGAYNVFMKAMFAGETETVWNQLAPSSQKFFDEQFEKLQAMDETIAKYLPPTDHKIARRQAGSILTDEVTDGKTLFLRVFDSSKIELSEAHKVGANVEEIQLSEDEKHAQVKTAGGEVWTMERADDKTWRMQLVRSQSSVKEAMKWLENNETALQQTVEDLIEEETTRREKIIAELMSLE